MGRPWFALPAPAADGTVGCDPGTQADRGERARRTRALLLATAARHFAADGYHGASLRGVLADAGLTKGALYFHFESKLDLAFAVTGEASANWRAIVAELATRGLDPLQEMLVQSDLAMARFEGDETFRAAMRVTSEAVDLAGVQIAWRTAWEHRTTDLLERARAAGLLRPEAESTGAIARTAVALQWGHHALAETLPDGPGPWERMNESWVGLLHAVATDAWIAGWRTCGWRERPAPLGAPDPGASGTSDRITALTEG